METGLRLQLLHSTRCRPCRASEELRGRVSTAADRPDPAPSATARRYSNAEMVPPASAMRRTDPGSIRSRPRQTSSGWVRELRTSLRPSDGARRTVVIVVDGHALRNRGRQVADDPRTVLSEVPRHALTPCRVPPDTIVPSQPVIASVSHPRSRARARPPVARAAREDHDRRRQWPRTGRRRALRFRVQRRTAPPRPTRAAS